MSHLSCLSSLRPGQVCNNDYLWRYVMENHKDDFGVTSVSCFYPREGEEYISVYHSNKEYYKAMVKELHRKIPVGKSKPAIYLSFSANEVLSEVNRNASTIDFKDQGYPHLGMWYLFDTTDNYELLEISTIILELSSFFQRNQDGEILLIED